MSIQFYAQPHGSIMRPVPAEAYEAQWCRREDLTRLQAQLSEVMAALDTAGCPIGNEHKTYDAVERIAGLHKTKDYAWRQMDEARERVRLLQEQIRVADKAYNYLHHRHRAALQVTTESTIDFLQSR